MSFGIQNTEGLLSLDSGILFGIFKEIGNLIID
jgi:hypothetical protein